MNLLDPINMALLGVFSGVFSRTILPYMQKRNGNNSLRFKMVFAQSAIYTLVVSLIATVIIFPAYPIPELHPAYIFSSAFAYGYTANDVINKVIT